MHNVTVNRVLALAGVLLLAWLLLAYAWLRYAEITAGQDLAASLQVEMPGGVMQHSRYIEDRAALSDYLLKRLSAELARISVTGRVPLLQHCSATVDERRPSLWPRIARGWAGPIPWPVVSPGQQAWLWVTCQGHWPVIIVGSGALLMFALLLTFLGWCLISQYRRLRLFTRRGLPLLQSLRHARAQPRLILRPATATVVCAGSELRLPSTPFIYYLWYAQRRLAGTDGGWYLNPSSGGSDASAAEEVLALMDALGAHSRARRELAEKGLRAKVLDQNRSKVKDELVRLLGEEVAAAYLFDAERDGRTARYRYRLRLEPGQIQIESATETGSETSPTPSERPL
ncbi:MAG: hypothetical protein ACNA7T_08575 [Haliea sp.]